jgi:hypothetical protein
VAAFCSFAAAFCSFVGDFGSVVAGFCAAGAGDGGGVNANTGGALFLRIYIFFVTAG